MALKAILILGYVMNENATLANFIDLAWHKTLMMVFSRDRRAWIKTAGWLSAASLFGNHLSLPASCIAAETGGHLIDEISLDTSVELSKLIRFYHGELGFELLTSDENQCSFRTGASRLIFSKTNSNGKQPFYHFAFNIPENKIALAETWQKTRSRFIKPPKHLNDPKFSDNIVHFRHWNAHAIFFYDPAGNVVEFIARHTLPNAADGPFSTSDILYISEIGLVVNDVYQASSQLKKQVDIPQYLSASETFLAHGDHHGLIIFFKENTLAAFQQGRHRKSFRTAVRLNRKMNSELWQIGQYPFTIRKSG